MSFSVLTLFSLGAMTCLTLQRMRRARFTPIELSSARFFIPEPPGQSQRHWVLCPPRWRNRSYLMQMASLGLLLLAACLQQLDMPTGTGLRVDIYVDRSGSMATRQNGQTRAEEAAAALRLTLETMDLMTEEFREVRISTFDLDVDEHVAPTGNLREVSSRIAGDIKPRLIGTDLSRLHRSLDKSVRDDAWTPTHVVVISDQPAPQWSRELNRGTVQWLNIAMAMNNHGFTRIEPVRAALTGELINVRIHMQAWGAIPVDCSLRVSTMKLASEIPITWDESGYARVELTNNPVFQSADGEALTLELLSGSEDAWPPDNHAAIMIPERLLTPVLWLVPGVPVPELPGWMLHKQHTDQARLTDADQTRAKLAVVTLDELGRVPEEMPVLVVGSLPHRSRQSMLSEGATGDSDQTQEVVDLPEGNWFLCSVYDRSPLLQCINLDALETSNRMQPLPPDELWQRLDQRVRPATELRIELAAFKEISGRPMQVGLASYKGSERRGPVVWMPSLPDFHIHTENAEPNELAWQGVFLNAVSWLMAQNQTTLFQLTDRSYPAPDYSHAPFRLPLHPGEGDTSHSANGRQAFDPQVRADLDVPGQWWQLPVLLALLLLCVERTLTLLGFRGTSTGKSTRSQTKDKRGGVA